jgi:hypothetical protein
MKKAQIKMGETIAIMIIFFFLLVFGFSFYSRFQMVSFQAQHRKNLDLRSIQVIQRASFLPELQCSFKNIQVDNCFDILKIQEFDKLLENNPSIKADYFDMFEFSDIRVRHIFPSGPTHMLYSNPLDNFSFNLSAHVPVSIYNATSKQYGFGVMDINLYAR